MDCEDGYTYGGVVVCNNGQVLSSVVCMEVPVGAAEIQAEVQLDGAVSEDTFRLGGRKTFEQSLSANALCDATDIRIIQTLTRN